LRELLDPRNLQRGPILVVFPLPPSNPHHRWQPRRSALVTPGITPGSLCRFSVSASQPLHTPEAHLKKKSRAKNKGRENSRPFHHRNPRYCLS
ncbi:MAG: hypothetical protein WA734_03995, partial [Candidatus Acidiferrales bacterium]